MTIIGLVFFYLNIHIKIVGVPFVKQMLMLLHYETINFIVKIKLLKLCRKYQNWFGLQHQGSQFLNSS